MYYWQQNSCYAEAMQEISIETINNLGFRFTAPSWTRTIINRNYFRLEEKMNRTNWTMRGVARKRSFDRTVVKKCPKCEQQVPYLNIQEEFFNHNMAWCLHLLFFYIFSLCYLQVFISRSEKNQMYDLWATVPPKLKNCNLMCTKTALFLD